MKKETIFYGKYLVRHKDRIIYNKMEFYNDNGRGWIGWVTWTTGKIRKVIRYETTVWVLY